MIMREKVNYVIDADISAYFDNIDHTWMMRCAEEKTRLVEFGRFVKEMNTYLRKARNKPRQTIWRMLSLKLQGHYNYYGLSGNFESINRYYKETCKMVFKWMNRRSQKKTWNYERFESYLITYPLLKPKLTYAVYNTW